MTRAEEELLILLVLGALLLGFLAYTHLSPRETASVPPDPLSNGAQLEAQDLVASSEADHVGVDRTDPATAAAIIAIPHEPSTSSRHPYEQAEVSLAVWGFQVEDLTESPNRISTPSSGPLVASGQIRNIGSDTWLQWVAFDLAVFGTGQEPLAQERFVVRLVDDAWLPGMPRSFSVELPNVRQQHVTGFGVYFLGSAAEPLPTTDIEAPPEEEAPLTDREPPVETEEPPDDEEARTEDAFPTTDLEADPEEEHPITDEKVPLFDEETKRKAEDKAIAATEDDIARAADR